MYFNASLHNKKYILFNIAQRVNQCCWHFSQWINFQTKRFNRFRSVTREKIMNFFKLSIERSVDCFCKSCMLKMRKNVADRVIWFLIEKCDYCEWKFFISCILLRNPFRNILYLCVYIILYYFEVWKILQFYLIYKIYTMRKSIYRWKRFWSV